jgi:hypothetical protein
MRKPFLIAGLLVAVGGGGYAVYKYLIASKTVAYVPPQIDAAPTRPTIAVPAVTFTDVTAAAGITFRHYNGAAGDKLLPETMGGGVAVIDYDADGWPDLLFVNSCPWPGHDGPEQAPCLTLYRNNGNGTFTDVTDAAGLRITLYGMGACVGDIDNDGYPDLFITAVGGNRLFKNVPAENGRKFVDVTAAAGLPPDEWPGSLAAAEFRARHEPIPFPSSATFLDYDGDGKLDLFVCYYVTWAPGIDLSIDATLTGIGRAYLQPQQFEGAQCRLYRNIDGTRFEDVSEAAGVTVVEKEGVGEAARLRNVGKSLGVIVCDPDGDGWPDLVVANDTVRNFFFHNVPDGTGGRKFVEDGMLANVAYAQGTPRGAMGIDWGEFLPGQQGIVITNFANEPNTLLRVVDPKRPRFTDSAEAFGLAGPSRFPLKFGAFFFDYDLDGRLDLLTCNGHLEPEISKNQAGQEYAQPPQLFWNTGSRNRLFEPVTAQHAGPDLFQPIVGRGCAYLDFDGDGDLDIVLVENNGPARLLRNDANRGHNWVRLHLEGDGQKSNRSAIGAQVIVEFAGNTLRRDVAGARGYLSQSEFPITIGLGSAASVEKVTVRWPGKDAAEQTWTNLPAGKTYTLKQGVTEPQ